jgi:hypothetical protein
MRFLPLLSSQQNPAAWNAFRDVEIAWEGGLHPGWQAAVRAGLGVHALHLGARPWGEALVLEALEVVGAGLGADFLVIPAEAPKNISEQSRFLGALEAMLEALQGRGVKIALRPSPGAVRALVALLKEIRCEAVGYCWDAGVGGDLEAIADRLFCAVGNGEEDFTELRRLGYRWNLALPSLDPDATARTVARLEASHPMIFFPEVTA